MDILHLLFKQKLQKIKVCDFCDESNSSFGGHFLIVIKIWYYTEYNAINSNTTGTTYKVTIFYKLDQVAGQHHANVIT